MTDDEAIDCLKTMAEDFPEHREELELAIAALGRPVVVHAQTKLGTVEVRATAVSGQWAAHPAITDGWSVSHLPTGLSAVHCASKTDAESALRAVADKRVTGNDDKEGLSTVKAALAAIGMKAGGNRQRVTAGAVSDEVRR